MTYFSDALNGLTQFFGAILGLTLNANESISGSAYRLRDDGRGWLYSLINTIFFWQDDHCLTAALNEITDSVELCEAYGFTVSDPHYAQAVAKAVADVDNAFLEEPLEGGFEEGD